MIFIYLKDERKIKRPSIIYVKSGNQDRHPTSGNSQIFSSIADIRLVYKKYDKVPKVFDMTRT